MRLSRYSGGARIEGKTFYYKTFVYSKEMKEIKGGRDGGKKEIGERDVIEAR